jgi:hypothetical protein
MPLKCAYQWISRQDTIVPGQELPTNFGTDLPWLIGGRGQITLDLYHSTCADLAMFLGLKISEGFWKGGFAYLSIGVLPIPIYIPIRALGMAVQLPAGAGCEAMKSISKHNATCVL